MGGECNTCGGKEKCTVLMEKPEGKRQLGRHSADVRITLKLI
jgi:hypothetical protein